MSRARSGMRRVRAQAAELHLLQNAQQLDLRKQAQIADLIEEERAVFSLFEVAGASAHRTGECALFMAEEFGFDQSFRNSAAGDSDKGSLGTGAKVVNGAGDQFLAGAAFAGDENRGVEVGYAADQLIHSLHVGCRAQNLIAARGFLDALLHGVQLLLQRGVLMRPLQHCLQIANGRGTAAVAEATHAHQLKCSGSQAVVREQNCRYIGRDQAPRAFDPFLQSVKMRGKIENHYVASTGGCEAVHPIAVRLQQNLKLFTKGGGKKRLQGTVFRVKSDSNHWSRRCLLLDSVMSFLAGTSLSDRRCTPMIQNRQLFANPCLVLKNATLVIHRIR